MSSRIILGNLWSLGLPNFLTNTPLLLFLVFFISSTHFKTPSSIV